MESNTIKKLRIYAMFMRLHELEQERKQNDYYRKEALSVIKITPRPKLNETYLGEVKDGRQNRRERRAKNRKK